MTETPERPDEHEAKSISWSEASNTIKRGLLEQAAEQLHDLEMRISSGPADWLDRETDSALVSNIEGVVELFALDYPDETNPPGLPPGESPQRNAVCDALTEALLYIGVGCGEACERTTIDLEDRVEVRGLARMMTVRDPEGLDGSLGENTKKLWERIGTALAPNSPVISSASPLSEEALVDLIYEAKLNRDLMNVDVDKPPFYPGEVIRGRIVLDIIRDRIRHLIRESVRLSASAPSPEDKGSET